MGVEVSQGEFLSTAGPVPALVENEKAHSSGELVNLRPAACQGGHRRNAPWRSIRKDGRLHEARPGTLGGLIHAAVRRTIEVAVEEELTAALGAFRYARNVGRGGYRNGHRPRALTGPTGPLALTLPRATLFRPTGMREWTSALVPRYQRRLREVNEAVVGTYPTAAAGAGAVAEGGAAVDPYPGISRNRVFLAARARAILSHPGFDWVK